MYVYCLFLLYIMYKEMLVEKILIVYEWVKYCLVFFKILIGDNCY